MCVACATRIERKLNRLEGVEATVELRDRGGRGHRDPTSVSVDDLIATVEAVGYCAALPAEVTETPDAARAVRRRLVVAAALTALAVLAMAPACSSTGGVARPRPLDAGRVLRGAAFHRATLVNASPPRRDDGHADLGGHARGVDVVDRRARGRDRRSHLLRGRGRDHDAILLGRWLELRARARSSEAIRALVELGAKEAASSATATRCSCRSTRSRSTTCSSSGPARIATDGVVMEGLSAIDQSMLTGEPVPVDVWPGAEVAGATINASGRLVVRVTRVGADTALAQIGRLVAEAQAGKAPINGSSTGCPRCSCRSCWASGGDAPRLAARRRGRRQTRSRPLSPC